MLTRSVLRAAAPVRHHLRTYASEANKATSNPKGTHGGKLPSSAGGSGQVNNKPPAYYAYWGAVALGLCGAGYYFLSGPGAPDDRRR